MSNNANQPFAQLVTSSATQTASLISYRTTQLDQLFFRMNGLLCRNVCVGFHLYIIYSYHRNGVHQSGVVCAVGFLLDKLKVDQEIDAFLAVTQIRLGRPQLIDSFVSKPQPAYNYLHLEYLKKSSINASGLILGLRPANARRRLAGRKPRISPMLSSWPIFTHIYVEEWKISS